MKRVIFIFLLALSTLLLLGIPAVAHHHHDGTPCVQKDECACAEEGHDGQEGHEKHHHHRHYPTGHDAGTHCAGEGEYMPGSAQDEVYCTLASVFCDSGHAVALLPPGALPASEENPPESRDYGEYLIPYRSVDPLRIGGLRGPPAILS